MWQRNAKLKKRKMRQRNPKLNKVIRTTTKTTTNQNLDTGTKNRGGEERQMRKI